MKRVVLSVLGLELQVRKQTVTAAKLQAEIPNEQGVAGLSLTPSKTVTEPLSKSASKTLRKKNGIAQRVVLSVALVLSLGMIKARAQEENVRNDEIQTLFNGGDNIRLTGSYAAFAVSGSQLNDGFGLLLGARGGVIVNHSFLIGGAGYGIIPTNKVTCPIPEHTGNHYLTGGYGGLFFEYIHAPNRLLHFTANTLVGFGGVTYTKTGDNNYNPNSDNAFKHQGSFVFVLEPGIAMDMNITGSFRMSLGVSYRYSPNFKLQYEGSNIVPKTAFNGFSVNLIFKFGNFSGVYTPPAVYVPPVVVPPVIIR